MSISAAGGDQCEGWDTTREEGIVVELLFQTCSCSTGRGVWEHCAELAGELSVLPSVLLYWLWRNQLLKRKVGNVLKWVMFVLWLSDCIHSWLSGSIQLLSSFPCSTGHRDPWYSCRQHAARVLLTSEVLMEGATGTSCPCSFLVLAIAQHRPKTHKKLTAFHLKTKVHSYFILVFNQELKDSINNKQDMIIQLEQCQNRECQCVGSSSESIRIMQRWPRQSVQLL